VAAVVGSGVMGERLAGGNAAIALLANTLATGAALVALILTFGPILGRTLQSAVTLADASQGGLAWRDVPAYIAAQIVGAFGGVAIAHLSLVCRCSLLRVISAQVCARYSASSSPRSGWSPSSGMCAHSLGNGAVRGGCLH